MSNLRFPPRNLPYESTPWGRRVEEVGVKHESDIEAIKSSLGNSDRSQSGQLAVLSGQVNSLVNTIARLPETTSASVTAADWTPPSGWQTIAQLTIPRRDPFNRADVFVSGFVTALAPSSGVLGFEARTVVNGVVSEQFRGTATGAAITQSTSYPSQAVQLTNLTGPVVIELQLSVASVYTLDRRSVLSAVTTFSAE